MRGVTGSFSPDLPGSGDCHPPRVLILSASTGNGHQSAAAALETEFISRGIKGRTVDMMDLVPSAFRTWYRGGYETLVKRCPLCWGYLYAISDRPGFTFALQTALDVQFTRRLDQLVGQFDPDWVVCVHSLPQPRLSILKERGARFRIAVVVTDLHPHLMWCRGNVDRYFVPDLSTLNALDSRIPGVRNRIQVSGIPVHPAFGDTGLQRVMRERLGIAADQPTVMVTAGGIGAGPIEEIVRSLSGLKPECALIVACGRNEAAYQRLVEMKDRGIIAQKNLHIERLLSQEDFAARMRACDFVVGKPGGLTMYECWASATPLVVYRPLVIPGQEERNLDTLISTGTGIVAVTIEELAQYAIRLLESPDQREAFRNKIALHARPHAASEIASSLM